MLGVQGHKPLKPRSKGKENEAQKSDVFAFGVMMWVILCREAPWRELDGVEQVHDAVVTNNRRPPIPPDAPRAYVELMQACWHRSAVRRPTFPEIVDRLTVMAEDLDLKVYRLSSTTSRGRPTSVSTVPLGSPRSNSSGNGDGAGVTSTNNPLLGTMRSSSHRSDSHASSSNDNRGGGGAGAGSSSIGSGGSPSTQLGEKRRARVIQMKALRRERGDTQ